MAKNRTVPHALRHNAEGAFALLDKDNDELLQVNNVCLLFGDVGEAEEYAERLDSNRVRYTPVEVRIVAQRFA